MRAPTLTVAQWYVIKRALEDRVAYWDKAIADDENETTRKLFREQREDAQKLIAVLEEHGIDC